MRRPISYPFIAAEAEAPVAVRGLAVSLGDQGGTTRLATGVRRNAQAQMRVK